LWLPGPKKAEAFFLGFSMAMHCSTNVLKVMCFFFWPGSFSPPPLLLVTPPVLEFESCDIEGRMPGGAWAESNDVEGGNFPVAV
jgi:hypothetical protein